ncbi:MAG: DUF1190 domain-containing protein [Phenylobacterium sp.]
MSLQTLPPMKRSRRLVMTTLMATASVSLTACGDGGGQHGATVTIDQGPPVDAYTYTSVQACRDAGQVPDEACERAETAAASDQDRNGPRFDEQRTCEDVYGQGQCVPRGQGGGGVWGPLLAGFVVGRMMDGGWRGTGLYRQDRDGGYYTAWGGRVYNDYTSGRTRIGANGIDPPAAIRQAPPKIQTRTSVLSRGGFGGRMSARSYSGGGHWGG